MPKKDAGKKPGKQPEKPKKLTLNDPVPPEVIQRLNELDEARIDLALQFLALEESRVQILSASHQVNVQKSRVFEKVITDRGLSPDVQAEIDPKTGLLSVLEGPPPGEPPS